MTRAVILVLDSFGIGAADDAASFGDAGANTFGHIAALARARRPQAARAPQPRAAGTAARRARQLRAVSRRLRPERRSDRRLRIRRELSTGKDTPSGHWEIAGVPVLFDWGYFRNPQQAFPAPLLESLIERGRLTGVLGNCHASGTEIIASSARSTCAPASRSSTPRPTASSRSPRTRRPSGSSACSTCARSRASWSTSTASVESSHGRSSAHEARDFARTGNRRDYDVRRRLATLLDKLVASGGDVMGVGKIPDIFAHQGISRAVKATATRRSSMRRSRRWRPPRSARSYSPISSTSTCSTGTAATSKAMRPHSSTSTAACRSCLRGSTPTTSLILSADHGCDPTWPRQRPHPRVRPRARHRRRAYPRDRSGGARRLRTSARRWPPISSCPPWTTAPGSSTINAVSRGSVRPVQPPRPLRGRCRR